MEYYLLGLEKSDHHIFMLQFDFSEKVGLYINVENTKGFWGKGKHFHLKVKCLVC